MQRGEEMGEAVLDASYVEAPVLYVTGGIKAAVVGLRRFHNVHS